MTFDEAYAQWLRDCVDEWNHDHGDDLTLRDEDSGRVGPGTIEFAEDGDAYPHGRGGVGHVSNAVTPWAESLHWIHWRAV